MSVVYHPAAAAEHFDHIAYYKSLNVSLALGYVEEFTSALDRIQ
ncbi:MAG: hypothetical protein Q4G62_08320 [Pseudomonadota bacterium]|nr:hypothetical protein [Pseudomonadota bacterium]